MNTKNFLLVLGITALIAIASFIYTTLDNSKTERVSNVEAEQESAEVYTEFNTEIEADFEGGN